MNQILWPEKLVVNEEIEYKDEVIHKEKRRKKRIVFKAKTIKAVFATLILIVTMMATVTVGMSTWNTTVKAMSQEEVQVKQLPQGKESLKIAVQETIKKVEENTLKDAKQKIKQPVIKKVAASNGKKYDTIAYLNIPSLGINYSVLASTSTELLKVSLNKYWGPNVNEVGNLCIVGHNYNDARFFGKLNKIKMGATIQLTDMTGRTVNYEAYKTMMVDPYNTSCTSQLTDGKREITLITCNVDGSARFVVKARAVE